MRSTVWAFLERRGIELAMGLGEGVTATQFARLVDEVGREYERVRFERLERPGRKRVQGADRKGSPRDKSRARFTKDPLAPRI